MNETSQQGPPQQPSATRTCQLKKVAARMVSFVGNNKKSLGIAAAVFVVIVVWLLHRDGFTPEESTGEITISTSGGEVIMTVPEQPTTSEETTDENP